ncbi:MAG: hypothetical protein HRU17_08595 [Polyangiaceae bacterium]|nr:hypothetical protein [Polyangiaceae bacterium]
MFASKSCLPPLALFSTLTLACTGGDATLFPGGANDGGTLGSDAATGGAANGNAGGTTNTGASGGSTSTSTGGTGGVGGTGSGEVFFEDPEFGIPTSADCNMNGHWIVRRLALPEANVDVVGTQPASSWDYISVAQEGNDFEIHRSVSCGIVASGSADTIYSPKTREALIHRLPWAGRTGTFTEDADGGCELHMNRVYERLGVPQSVQDSAGDPLPDNIESSLDLAEDWDDDGFGGVAYQTSGFIVNGTRHAISVQWHEFHSNSLHVIPLGSDNFTVGMDYDLAEAVVDAQCRSNRCLLLRGAAVIIPEADNAARLHLLGRTLDEAIAGGVYVAEDDFQICLNAMASFPHTDQTL